MSEVKIPATAEVKESSEEKTLREIRENVFKDYSLGFTTDIEQESLPPGLNEDVVRKISALKEEPEWLLEKRLEALALWKTMKEPHWCNPHYDPINYQDIVYYAAPKNKPKYNDLSEVEPELLETYKKLGIPLEETKRLLNVAVDAVFDSVSIATTFKESLEKKGIIFCSFSEAVREHPELVKKYMGMVVPANDNFFAALNTAVFSDGSFCYIPKGVKCPMDLSTYFRINALNVGQFERTLIIAEEGSSVNYLEGCSAPMRDENQLHAAIVELIAMDDAEINYSTLQNWYPGDENGKGGIFNFVVKRGLCLGKRSHISWTQVETGSAITWKYPSCILQGDESMGSFYSVAVTNKVQEADTGTKMIHLGKNTRSKIVSKGISAGRSSNTYRGMIRVHKKAENAKNFSQCDSLMLSPSCKAITLPTINVENQSAMVEHEAYTGKVGESQLFYLMLRGLSEEDAVALIVTGFCREVLKRLPLEFSVEAIRLVEACISMPGTMG